MCAIFSEGVRLGLTPSEKMAHILQMTCHPNTKWQGWQLSLWYFTQHEGSELSHAYEKQMAALYIRHIP